MHTETEKSRRKAVTTNKSTAVCTPGPIARSGGMHNTTIKAIQPIQSQSASPHHMIETVSRRAYCTHQAQVVGSARQDPKTKMPAVETYPTSPPPLPLAAACVPGASKCVFLNLPSGRRSFDVKIHKATRVTTHIARIERTLNVHHDNPPLLRGVERGFFITIVSDEVL